MKFYVLIFSACSNSYFAPNIKIVGGIPAVPNSWPAQILLIVDKSIIAPGLYGKCGGTIVDRYTVVTAAHCLIQPTETYNGRKYTITNPLNPTAYKVYAGAHNIDFTNYYNSDPTAPTVRLQVKKVIQVFYITNFESFKYIIYF
jgi:secreted trypsin-like serine protease